MVIFPIILWASVAGRQITHTCVRDPHATTEWQATGVGSVYFDSQASVAKENVFAPSTGCWITAFLADALFTNLFCTRERYQSSRSVPTDGPAAPIYSFACIPDMEGRKTRDETVIAWDQRVVAHLTDHTRCGGTLLGLAPDNALVLRDSQSGTLCDARCGASITNTVWCGPLAHRHSVPLK